MSDFPKRKMKCRSSYGQPRWERRLASNEYLLSGKVKYLRWSNVTEQELAEFPQTDRSSLNMVDLDGGPALWLGQSYQPGPYKIPLSSKPEIIVDLRIMKKPNGSFQGILIKTRSANE